MTKHDFLKKPIEHISIADFDSAPLITSMSKMAFQARNLARAAMIYDEMVADPNCTIILTLAGSLFSAGLKRVVLEMIEANMVDVIVSTGANMIDQDFFEALGYKHYIGDHRADDTVLRSVRVDRIYDTYVDEDELLECDEAVCKVADSIDPKPYSSREFLIKLSEYLKANERQWSESVIYQATAAGIPIFVPALSDSSAGHGMFKHQMQRPDKHVSFDSAKDFVELPKVMMASQTSGVLMMGGGVPKNFAQDSVSAPEILGHEVRMHKYAIQVTVADERDGALSGSTLREAGSWGKVDNEREQMVYAEATVALPLIASYAYHRRRWEGRARRNFNRMLDRK